MTISDDYPAERAKPRNGLNWKKDGTARCGQFEATIDSIHGLDCHARIVTSQGALVKKFRVRTPAIAKRAAEAWLRKQVGAMRKALGD